MMLLEGIWGKSVTSAVFEIKTCNFQTMRQDWKSIVSTVM